MQTECPHCLTLLKVGTEIVYAADPRVRCGECLHVFSAREHLQRAPDTLEATRLYPPSRQAGAARAGERGAAAALDEESAPRRSRAAARRERPRRAAIPTHAAAPAHRPSAEPPPPAESPPPEPPPAARHVPVIDEQRARDTGGTSSWLSAGLLALLAVVVLAGAGHWRAAWQDTLAGQRLAAWWCGWRDCGPALSRDFGRLQVVRRKIYSHPQKPGVLVISLAMVNERDAPLAYPTLQVRMTGRDGAVVAHGQFPPADYAAGWAPGAAISTEQLVDVLLEVADPGEAAQSFDLQFL